MTRPAISRIKVNSTTQGTGTFTLGSAISGEHVQAFPESLDGHLVFYSIDHEDAAEWESGYGVYTHSSTTLTRVYVETSSNSDAKVSFSSGTKVVRVTDLGLSAPHFDTVDPDADDDLSSGFIAGRSTWFNTVTGKLWLCTGNQVGSPLGATWGRFVTADEIGELSLADDAVTNAKLANMPAWTIKLRNAATTGDPSDAALANINTEGTPQSGDFLLGFLSTGEIRKFDIGNLPGGVSGSGSAINVGTDGVGVFDGVAGSPESALGFRHIAPASSKITVVLNDADIDLDVDEANFTIPAESITSGVLDDAVVQSSNVRQHLDWYDPIDGTAAGGNVTLIPASRAGQTIKVDQNLTLDNAFPEKRWVVINNVHASTTITITVEAGAGQGTINGSSTYQLPSGGEVLIRCISNAGDAPICDARGDGIEVDFGGREVKGNLGDVVTGVSGTLTNAHLGRLVVTSGNITVPTTAGFNCLVKAGGAHTITFNSTVTGAATTGQVCSVYVQSTTVVIITPWTTPQTLT